MSSDIDCSLFEIDLLTFSDELDVEDKLMVVLVVFNIILIIEKERLSLIILFYIVKYKLSGFVFVDFLDFFKFIILEDKIL